jgi:hypothetical protein
LSHVVGRLQRVARDCQFSACPRARGDPVLGSRWSLSPRRRGRE